MNDHPELEGATFMPVILGSDKTTVSVATGQHDYYPLYLSLAITTMVLDGHTVIVWPSLVFWQHPKVSSLISLLDMYINCEI